MTLPDALRLRRELEARTGVSYGVARSAERSLKVTPFYVHRVR